VLSHDRDEKEGYEPPPVLLFLRKTGKTGKIDQRAAPFTHCGELDFVTCQGEKPITTVCKLRRD
jgi:hypothetical protein